MTVRLAPAPEADSYLLVSENWYPDWQATVDGRPAEVLRGDYTFITVGVPRGAREVRLAVHSHSYRAGRLVSAGSLGLIWLWLVVPAVLRRRRG